MDKCCPGSGYLEALAGEATPVTVATRETVLAVEGATCGACVARIESALASVGGVAAARFNLATRRARVNHAEEVTLAELEAAVARAGYRAGAEAAADPRRERRVALWRTGVAGLAMMQVMMLAFPVYVADEGTLDWDIERLLAVASLLLTIPVLAFSAVPIWRGAWRGLRSGHPGMDVPVALGIVAAFAASLPATFQGGAVYYESIAMFVFFLSAGRYFESGALATTVASSEALARLMPRRAVRLDGPMREEVDPAALRPGDRVWIAAGESAPADCALLSGCTDFNEALLTGESAPAAKRAGDSILAGSVNLTAPVEASVVRTGEDQTLALVRRMVERAADSKPRWALQADRFAGHFVVAVVVLAAAAALYWLAVEPAMALPVAIAVLVVSCPCALSLATPVALTACANALAARGVLVARGSAIEALASVDRVVLDKTGTLTTGRMRIAAVETFGELARERCLAIAAALEQAMPHPVAHALIASAEPATGVTDLAAFPGAGVEARVEGIVYRVGSAAFCEVVAGVHAPQVAGDAAAPRVMMATRGAWLAAIGFDDTLRAESTALVQRLRDLGCEVSLLSGDRPEVVERVAAELRIGHAVPGASPAVKLRTLEDLARSGQTVAMVGDGVNDAPCMAAAHVAIALGQGAALAQSQADLIVLNPSLLAIAEAIGLARRTRRVIAQNLGWAAAYNAVSLPLALTGLLAPWMASLGMSLSSLLVVLNALRIMRR